MRFPVIYANVFIVFICFSCGLCLCFQGVHMPMFSVRTVIIVPISVCVCPTDVPPPSIRIKG